MTRPTVTCAGCRTQWTPVPGLNGRPRVYCSAKCKQAHAYRMRVRAQMKRAA